MLLFFVYHRLGMEYRASTWVFFIYYLHIRITILILILAYEPTRLHEWMVVTYYFDNILLNININNAIVE